MGENQNFSPFNTVHWPLANGEKSLRQRSSPAESTLVDEDTVGSDEVY